MVLRSSQFLELESRIVIAGHWGYGDGKEDLVPDGYKAQVLQVLHHPFCGWLVVMVAEQCECI